MAATEPSWRSMTDVGSGVRSSTRSPGDAPPALGTGERLEALGQEHGFALYRAVGGIAHGWARARLGAPEEALAELRDLTAAHASVTGRPTTFFAVALAEVERRTGYFQRAHTALANARAVVTERGDQLWLPAVVAGDGQLGGEPNAPGPFAGGAFSGNCWRPPASSGQSHSSCRPRSVWRSCGADRVNPKTHAVFWRRSSAGSLRASTHPT